ncbi:MAG TPA: hypothetical protein VMR76_01755, partial [Candidatus Saccharimonadia bacterium]|nr:hypothetical protein [Candidatus Saccharimonadia bacterium]
VSGALNTLRKYIYSNMNTNLDSGPNAIYPPIQLKYTYQRLVAQAELQAIVTNNQYAVAANAYCIKQNPNYSLQQKTTCEEQYFESQPSTIPSIPTALYEYDFQSPIWSPDLAGYSLLVSGGSLIAIASVFIHNRTRRFSK